MKEGDEKEMTDGQSQELSLLARIDELDRLEQSVRIIEGNEAIIKLINERKEELRQALNKTKL